MLVAPALMLVLAIEEEKVCKKIVVIRSCEKC